MKSKWRVMLSVVAAVFLLSLLAVPVLAATTATRTIGDTTLTVGQSTTVTVSITTDEFSVVLTEDVPAGLEMSDPTASGGDVAFARLATGEFIWLNTDESALGPVTASYTLTATAAGSYPIGGTVIDIEANVVATVAGDSSVVVSGAAGTTATRAITDTSLEVGQSTAVTVTIETDEFSVILRDVVPAGWPVSGAGASGADVSTYSAGTGEFLWLDTDGDALGTVTAIYTLTVPAGAEGTTGYINGTVIDNEENEVATVGGDSAITVEDGEAPPGDYPSFTDWLTSWIS